uniref:Uncharacterized protein n=1 Tax=Vespula pensylvanica TaxID=30213 RepID=A0A834PAU3_VESPE|nr:hypothetical protein H0235_003105 [Vespula pensylvanica]
MTETLEFYVSILFSIRYQPYGLESLAFRVSAAIATAVANVVVDVHEAVAKGEEPQCQLLRIEEKSEAWCEVDVYVHGFIVQKGSRSYLNRVRISPEAEKRDAFLDFLPAAQLSVMLAVTTGIRRKRRPERQYCPLNSIRRNVENSVRSQPNILWIAFVVRGK